MRSLTLKKTLIQSGVSIWFYYETSLAKCLRQLSKGQWETSMEKRLERIFCVIPDTTQDDCFYLLNGLDLLSNVSKSKML